MQVELLLYNGKQYFIPAVQEGITWDTERKGVPGKLCFTVVKDDLLDFSEGNHVRLKVDGKEVFYGFVFTKKRGKDNLISVTAYDQLRYLKNKDTIVYQGKKASELLQMIAADFRLQCGDIADTGYVIESGVEENQTLFDVIQNALDETLQATKKLYVLYDNYGKLTLKNVEDMKLDLLIDETAAQDLDYTSSIDEQTYNEIKLTYDNEESGKRDAFVAQDGENMNQWGVLQYYESLQTDTGAQAKADALLGLYNQRTRKLSVKDAFGDLRARAGSSVVVALDLGDVKVRNYMVVEKAKHTFNESLHTMDLTLIGGEFIA